MLSYSIAVTQQALVPCFYTPAGVQFAAKAFQQIHFEDYEIADHTEWFLKRQTRDRNARKDYFRSKEQRYQKGDLYITHILDEGIKPDDERLRSHLS